MKLMKLVGASSALMLAFLGPAATAQPITEIIDVSGDGAHGLDEPRGIAVGIAVEGAGNVYVAGRGSDNAFKITPDGTVVEIIDASGDGPPAIHDLVSPWAVAVDAKRNVYLTGGLSNNAFRIAPSGAITEIIDNTGDGTHLLNGPRGIAVDASRNVYVAGKDSDNAFKITPGGTITEIIDASGDGSHGLDAPRGIAVDVVGNVYVAGAGSDNAFKVTPGGTISEIIDASGDGTHSLSNPQSIAVDASRNIYVAGYGSDNVFKLKQHMPRVEIIDASGDGIHDLDGPWGIAVDATGNVYVAGMGSDNAFKITPGGAITEIIDASGDGSHGLEDPWEVAAGGSGIVYVAGKDSDNAFKITPAGTVLSAVAGLVVPGFEVEVEDPQGPTTFFAVRNTSGEEVLGRADYYGSASTEPLRSDAFILGPRETLARDVRADLSGLEVEDGLATGFVVITELGGTTAPNLEGDYFRLDWGNDFATGDRLVRPADFCVRQEIRFVDFGSGSQLRVLLNRPRGEEVPSFSYTAYAEDGTVVASGEVSTSDYLSVLDIGELVPGNNFGTVWFDFSSSGGGWVSARYSAFGRFSVELNAACRDG